MTDTKATSIDAGESTENIKPSELPGLSLAPQLHKIEAPTEVPEIPSNDPASELPAAPPIEKKPLTVLELKTNNLYLPKLFFTRKVSTMQLGMIIHGFLRNVGLGIPHEDAVTVPGYLWASQMFSPVEIAVASYLYYAPQATAKEIAKARKLPERLTARTLGALEELGLFEIKEWGSDKIRKVATLEDFIGMDGGDV